MVYGETPIIIMMKLSEIVSRDPVLGQYFDRVQNKYTDSHQLAFYTNPNQYEKLYMTDAGSDEVGDSVFIFVGTYQDSQPDRQ